MSCISLRFKGQTRFGASVIGITLASVALVGCNDISQTLQPRQTYVQGYVIDQETIDLVPVGSSREQVLLALGTPSTQATFDEQKAFYYVSQTRTRAAAFMKAKVVDQRVLAVYFDDKDVVSQIGNYGLQDGKVFDFITRTTPTGGKDSSFLSGLISGVAGGGAANANRNARDILGN